MRPIPPLPVKTWLGGGGGVWHVALGGGGGGWQEGGEEYWRYSWGGGFLNTMQFPRFSNFSRSSVAMVCHWAVQREQNKDQRYSAPFKESRTRTKHIVPPSTKHAKNGTGTTISQNSRGGVCWGGGVAYKDRGWPPAPAWQRHQKVTSNQDL